MNKFIPLIIFIITAFAWNDAFAQLCDGSACEPFCEGDPVTFTITTVERTSAQNYGYLLFLTQSDGTVIEISPDLAGVTPPTNYTFITALPPGTDYRIYALSYNVFDPPSPIPGVGQNISAVGSVSMGCFDLSDDDVVNEYICFNILPAPAMISGTLTVCETVEGTSIGDFTLTAADAIVATGGEDVLYYNTLVDALGGTGAIGPTYSSGSRTIYATVTDGGGCQTITTVDLTVDQTEDASFAMASFCAGGPSSTPAVTGISGGMFSMNPVSGTLDVNTGIITGAAPGTYDITYTTPGLCAGTETVSVTAYDCTCSATTPICQPDALCAVQNEAVPADFTQVYLLTDDLGNIISLNTSGTFTSSILSTGMTYRIYTLNYEITNQPSPNAAIGVNVADIGTLVKGCFNDNLLATSLCYGIIAPPAAATNPVNQSYCEGSPVATLAVDDPGAGNTINWYDAAVGGNAVTGATLSTNNEMITLGAGSVPAAPAVGGTVTIYAEVLNTLSGCVSGTRVAVTLVHLASDEASFTIANFCVPPGLSSEAVVTGFIGGSFDFTTPPGDGALIDPMTGVIGNGFAGTTYSVDYTTTGACPITSTFMVDALDCVCTATKDVCEGEPVCFTNAGFETTGNDYALHYYLTEQDGTIIEFSDQTTASTTDILFSFSTLPAPGDGYGVYILSYLQSDPPTPLPTTSGSVFNIGSTDQGCMNVDFFMDYICYNVKPNPFINPTADTVCVGTPLVTLFGNASATDTVHWEIIAEGTTVSEATIGTGDLTGFQSDTVMVNTAGYSRGTVAIEYYAGQTAAGCFTRDTTTIFLTYPEADPLDAIVCVGDMVAIPANDMFGDSYLWTVFDAGTTGANSGNLINTTTNTVTLDASFLNPGTATLQLTLTDTEVGCVLDSFVMVEVIAIPVITLTDPGSVCSSDGVINFTGTPTPGAAGTGTFTSTAGTGFTDIGDGTAALDPVLSGPGTFDVKYVYSTAPGMCMDSLTVSVTVVADPVVTISNYDTLCLDGFPVIYTGAPNVPLAGTFSTDYTGTFDPGTDGTATFTPDVVGTFGVTYSYVDEAGCTGTATDSITVRPLDDASFTLTDFCFGDTPTAATITGVAGGAFAILDPIASGSSIDSMGTLINPVSKTVYTIQYTSGGVCPNTSTATVEVFEAPVVTLNDPIDECSNSTRTMDFTGIPTTADGAYTISPAAGGFFVDNNDGTAVLTPDNSIPGTYTVTYTYTDPLTGCSNSAAVEVTLIDANGDPSFTFPDFCGSTGFSPRPTIDGTTGGVWGFGALPTGGNIDPVTGIITDPVEGEIYVVTYTVGLGCGASTQDSVLSQCGMCPVITGITGPATQCQNSDFMLMATDLASMAMADNSEADFGIDFVYFSGTTAPADPYTGGTLLGNVPFASLTGADPNQVATTTISANTLAGGTYQVCAILSPASVMAGCAPSQCYQLVVNAVSCGTFPWNGQNE